MSSLSPSKFKRKACKILLNDGHAIKNIQKKKKSNSAVTPGCRAGQNQGATSAMTRTYGFTRAEIL
jgi:hypothetical protein